MDYDDHPAAAPPAGDLAGRDGGDRGDKRRHKDGSREKKHKHRHKDRHKDRSPGGEVRADGGDEAEEGELPVTVPPPPMAAPPPPPLPPPPPPLPCYEAAPPLPRDARDDRWVARPRSRSRSQPAGRRERSAERRRGGGHGRSRSPGQRDWERGRERGREQAPRSGHDIERPRNGRGDAPRDHRRHDDRRRSPPRDGRRRSRSRSRSRGRGKRERSENRGRQREQQQQEEDEDAFRARVAAALEAQAGEDEDKLIEERRRRRQEILAKHRQQQAAADAAVAPTATDVAADAVAQQDGAAGAPSAAQPAAAAAAPLAPAAAAPPAAAEEAEALPDDEDAVMAELGTEAGGALDIWRHDHDAAAAAAATAAPPPPSGTGEADGEELQRRLAAAAAAQSAQAAADDEDDDVEDIFAATPEDAKRAEAGGGAAGAPAAAAAAAPARPRGLVDNYDDAEGYYVFQVGEIVGDRYEVFATHGRGVFASVLRARDLAAAPPAPGAAPPEVAIKVIRANDTMYKAGQTERVILRKLAEADPAGRRHVIRMLGSFEYRHHLCLVFEPMDCNLRELTKRYGRGIGLSLSACRVYAQQLLVALHHLRACGVVHADVKPDNILVNARRTVVKVCDLGSAMFAGDNEITPYLVSRFYRAPEVVLGLPYDHPLDMWSVGCVLFELATGRILFPGRTNNEMLKLMMDAKGPFPRKMLRKGEFAPRHFEPDAGMSFALLEEDKATGRPLRRLVPHPAVKADFAALLAGQSPDRRKLAQLADLLERMLALDPERRITPKEALRHPFIKDAPPAGG